MIDLETAAALIDFGARIGHGQRSCEQLEGAVALHNILCERGVAYLADEVGMGKTYVALGVLALFRHYEPDAMKCSTSSGELPTPHSSKTTTPDPGAPPRQVRGNSGRPRPSPACCLGHRASAAASP